MIPSPYDLHSPSCFAECYDDDSGRCDPYRFYQYRRSQRDGVVKNDFLKIITMCAMVAKEEAADELIVKEKHSGKKIRGPYAQKEPRLLLDPVTRQQRQFGPKDTAWYFNYVSNPKPGNKKFEKKFRRRFCCSYKSFLKHLEEVKSSELFKAWAEGYCTVAGKASSHIELLVLRSLRYLGRGWCFDDLEEATCISEEVHRQFLHVCLFMGFDNTS